MKRIIFILTILILHNNLFSQNNLIVYFEDDKFFLSNENQIKLDKYFYQFKPEQTDTIYIDGYCDSLATLSYNFTLAHNRALEVKKYIQKLPNCKNLTLKALGNGELCYKDKEYSKNIKQNRKVVINHKKTIIEEEKKISPIVKTTKPKNISKWVDEAKVGDKLTLKNINFMPGQTIVLPESMEQLNELLETMLAMPRLKIEIEGHICCSPNDVTDLSTHRARKVYDYLVENNVSPKRMTYKGFGNTKALFPYPEKSSDEMIANRRVEIKIVEK